MTFGFRLLQSFCATLALFLMGCVDQEADVQGPCGTPVILSDQKTADAKNKSAWVAYVLEANGVFAVAADGSYKRINTKNWRRSRVAIKTAEGEVLNFHAGGLYRLSLDENDCASDEMVKNEDWHFAKSAIRSPFNPESIDVETLQTRPGVFAAWQVTNVYRVDAASGSWSPLESQSCGLKAYDENRNVAIGIGTTRAGPNEKLGVRRIDLKDLNETRLSDFNCTTNKGVVSDPERDAAVVICSDGIHRISLDNGKVTKLNSEGWGNTLGAVYSSDGKALIFTSYGIYQLDLVEGTYTKVNSENWSMGTVAPMGRHTNAASDPF